MTKKQIINKVKEIILKYAKPDRIYLYGSQNNGEAKKGSDIDIAYDDIEFKSHYLIEDEILKLETLTTIDVKNIAKSEERFKNRVKSTGKVIYSATKKLRAEDGLYNFSNALKRFVKALEQEQEIKDEGFEDLFLDLTIKRFEFTYEMGWKALKRYLEYLGFEVNNPRMTFKLGYAQNILEDEQIWLEIIECRNLSSHIYDEYEMKDIVCRAEFYKNAFKNLEQKLIQGIGAK